MTKAAFNQETIHTRNSRVHLAKRYQADKSRLYLTSRAAEVTQCVSPASEEQAPGMDWHKDSEAASKRLQQVHGMSFVTTATMQAI